MHNIIGYDDIVQRFFLSPAAKTLSLGSVPRMSDADATFCKVCWPEKSGKPVCLQCGGMDAYDCRRPNGAPRFRIDDFLLRFCDSTIEEEPTIEPHGIEGVVA